MRPILIVNFKAYKEAHGTRAVKLAKMCAQIAAEHRFKIAVVPALHDVGLVAASAGISVFSPHMGIFEHGAYTGHVTVSGLKSAGVKGALINHSEKPVSREHVIKAVQLCRQYNLVSVVCAPTLKAVQRILADCEPDYIAYEPPELIGGDVSVTSASPEIVKKAAAAVAKNGRKTKLLCGAGVKNGADMKAALRLGAVGVLVASGVVKAKEPEKVLRELVSVL